MVTCVSNKLADFLLQRSIIEQDQKEIYVYGAELFLSDIINFTLILAMGAIFHRIETSILFLLCFVPTRRFCGGYHASTHFRCRCAMIVTFLSLLLICKLFPQDRLSHIIFMNIASIAVIASLAPVPNPNKPLSEICRKRNHLWATCTAFLLGIVSTVIYFYGKPQGTVICLTLFIIAILMIMEIQKRKG